MTYNVNFQYEKEGYTYSTTISAVETINDALNILNAALLSQYIVTSITLEPNE
jgi:hypothetical protein